jgi:hypothetical protein
VKSISLNVSYQLRGTYAQTLVDTKASCGVKFDERASFDKAWGNLKPSALPLASGTTATFHAAEFELPAGSDTWSIDGTGHPGDNCDVGAVPVHCSGKVERATGAGTGAPWIVAISQGGNVMFQASAGTTGLDEDGNDCLTGSQWDGGAPTIYPALGDATGPYMIVDARTTLTALARLKPGAMLKLPVRPQPTSGYSPTTCNHAADGETIATCSATLNLTGMLIVKRAS